MIDAQPVQCLRLPGSTFVTAAMFLGGVFIFATFHWWVPTSISAVLALDAILV